MMNNLTNKYFWFSPPSTILSSEDKILMYVFIGLVVLSIIIAIGMRFGVSNAVTKKLLKKIGSWTLWVGLGGVLWGIFRYENTPIFSVRYWAGLNVILGVVWLLYILKYLFVNYRAERQEYQREYLKSKYIPKAK